jgi:hypothetical protein
MRKKQSDQLPESLAAESSAEARDSLVQRWLDLARELLSGGDDNDPSPSAA